MEFRLKYQGKLKANGSPEHKHEIRECFHKQLKILWELPPLNKKRFLLDSQNRRCIISKIGNYSFAPLVNEEISTLADLNIILLKPGSPGHIVTQGGDIDNQLKTLLDSLRMPKENQELPANRSSISEETPFFCLLKDDNLITHLSVTSDRLLSSNADPNEVLLIIHVVLKGEILIFDDVVTHNR